MTGRCHGCGEDRLLEPYSKLCLACLIAAAKHLKQIEEPKPFDPKVAAAGRDD